LVSELIGRGATVIVALDGPSARAAKAATTTIPIVFQMAGDPVAAGLVTSLARPGGNLSGVTTLGTALGAKRLELLHELIPTATTIGLLVNPTNPNADGLSREMHAAAREMGVLLQPAGLPVQQVTKIEMIVNLKAAKALMLAIPTSLLGRADEVIEQVGRG